jgi:RNA polymerase sigma-70 factor (ECF subfamily)
MVRNGAFDDKDVIARCRRGDEGAWRALVERYQNMVYAVARPVAGPAADDVVQETFIRVFRKLHTFRDDAKFSTWLYRVAYNCACDAAGRRRAVGEDAADLNLPDERPGPAARAESEEHALLAREALARIKPEYRRVLELHYLLGKSYGETAAVTGLPLGTVKSHIHRGKTLLLRELTRMGVAVCLAEGL